MSLYAKVVLLLCTLFATYGAVDFLVQRRVILPSFEALEADLARTDMDRARRAIERELDQLQTFSADWGNWLDTYQYMAGENPAFVEENMTPVTLEAAGPRRGRIRRRGRTIRLAKRPQAGHAGRRRLRLPRGSGPRCESPVHEGDPGRQWCKRHLVTEHGPAMLVVAPVLDGAGNGPHRGAVLLARVITPEVAARLAEQAQVDLEVTTTPPSALGAAAERESLLQPRVVTLDYTNQVHRNLEDIFGDPSVVLRIDVPRKVSAQGRDAIGYRAAVAVRRRRGCAGRAGRRAAPDGAAPGQQAHAASGPHRRGRRSHAAYERQAHR